mgnify:CR=1 FL=1
MKTTTRYPLKNLALALLLALFASPAFAQVGVGTTTPNADAQLDVVSTSKGLLIPRLSLTGTANVAPLSAHVAGMLVYNSATAGDVTPGFYYNDGTKWVRVGDAAGGDPTNDAWVNDNANTRIHLGTLSDGTTARTAGTEFVALDNGNVAIGSASMTTPIYGSGSHKGMQITTDGGSATLGLESYRNTTNGAKIWSFGSRGTKAAPVNRNNGDYILELNASTYDGTNFNNNARIALAVDNIGTVIPGTSAPGLISFRTTPDGSTSDVERMRINSLGNVGVGTTAPSASLTVASSTKNPVIMSEATGAFNPTFATYGSTNNKSWTIQQTMASGDRLSFQAWDGKYPSLSNPKFVMAIMPTGRVGINNGSPTNDLHVLSTANPLRLEGLQTSNTNSLMSVDATGVVTKASTTGAIQMPVGTTAQRPAAPSVGMMRFNTTLNTFEGWNGTIWQAL